MVKRGIYKPGKQQNLLGKFASAIYEAASPQFVVRPERFLLEPDCDHSILLSRSVSDEVVDPRPEMLLSAVCILSYRYEIQL